jgi:hypothetical protein
MIRLLATTLALTCIPLGQALAWGDEGRRIVCGIALARGDARHTRPGAGADRHRRPVHRLPGRLHLARATPDFAGARPRLTELMELTDKPQIAAQI